MVRLSAEPLLSAVRVTTKIRAERARSEMNFGQRDFRWLTISPAGSSVVRSSGDSAIAFFDSADFRAGSVKPACDTRTSLSVERSLCFSMSRSTHSMSAGRRLEFASTETVTG
jgi:hypothetical protein